MSLDAQIDFLREADRLKTVLRASRLIAEDRRENSAEHSWHLCLYAMVLADHAPEGTDLGRVLQMLILHDLVEIDAGDAPIHGAVDHAAMAASEAAAADRLFGMLPAAQGRALRAIWEEFEAAETAEARFARALDRFQTPVANLANGGGTWADYAVTLDDLDARIGPPVRRGAPALWSWLRPRLAAFFAEA